MLRMKQPLGPSVVANQNLLNECSSLPLSGLLLSISQLCVWVVSEAPIQRRIGGTHDGSIFNLGRQVLSSV